jgi:dipeptidyl aminopeptidase/acylaminoacyl peptidase
MGTPDYMAPEQVSDIRAADHRADLYSLGCTLYKLLGGQPPFGGPRYSTAFEKMTAHVREPAPPIGELRSDLPGALVAFLERMLAKQPDGRPATAVEVAETMARFVGGCDLPRLLARAEAAGSSAAAADPANLSWRAPGVSPGMGRTAGQGNPRADAPGSPSRLPLFAAGAVAAAIIVALLAAIIVRGGRPDRETSELPDDEDQAAARAVVGTVQPSELPGSIVISWSRPRMRLSRPELWLFSPDGKRRKQLTNDPRYYDVQPCFSPDGRRIAFLRGQDPLRPNSIWVCNSDGTDLRQVVGAKDENERLASPAWVSKSWLYYSRDPKPDRVADGELWAVEIDAQQPRQVCRFRDTLGEGVGLVTGVSPDGQQLAVIAQAAGSSATADVYVTDLQGRRLHAIWEDRPDEYKDARAVWSPDGARIAWHHNFAAGTAGKSMPYGVGIATLGRDRKWSARLQPDRKAFITPLCWAPRGKFLLCARVHDSGEKVPPVTLLLLDDQFREVCPLFDLEVSHWDPAQRDLGRTADWIIVPGNYSTP